MDSVSVLQKSKQVSRSNKKEFQDQKIKNVEK